MAVQGFEFLTVDPIARQKALTGKSRISDEEFVKRFGYGISTLFGRGNARSDPNDAIRRRLTVTERAAYDRALWGDFREATFEEAVHSEDFQRLGGCTKQATDTVLGGAAVLAALQDKLAELDKRVASDRRMVTATERWSACMRDAGYRYAKPDDIEGDILERFRAIAGVGIRAGATLPPDPGTSYDPTALAELQRLEVKVANTDIACRKRYIAPVESVVRPPYEAQFRMQNGKLLAHVRR